MIFTFDHSSFSCLYFNFGIRDPVKSYLLIKITSFARASMCHFSWEGTFLLNDSIFRTTTLNQQPQIVIVTEVFQYKLKRNGFAFFSAGFEEPKFLTQEIGSVQHTFRKKTGNQTEIYILTCSVYMHYSKKLN